MALLRSFLGGAWVPPTGEGQPVFDAVTGEEVARDLVRRASTSRPRWPTGAGSAARRCAS